MAKETKDIIRLELLMDAGNGAQKVGDIFIHACSKQGRNVYIEPMIPSEISPPGRTIHSMSGCQIRLANFDINSIGSYSEFMLAEQEVLMSTRFKDKEYDQNNCVCALDMGDQARNEETYASALKEAEECGVRVIPFNRSDEANSLIAELKGRGINMFYLGILTGVFNVETDLVEAEIRKTFKKLPEDILSKNVQIFVEGVKVGQEDIDVSFDVPAVSSDSEKVLMDGNTAIGMGMIDAGIKVFSGYPITPATSVMHSLAQYFPTYGGIVHQAEDEISAVGAAIGSYYAGVPTATCTSGPGLSLKEEFIGLSEITETPLILVDVQRCGPATGIPTRSEQSDLPCAVFGSHGDNTKVVFSAAGVEDCFYSPHVARYLTEKLRMPVFIMTDGQTSVSYKVFEKPELLKMDGIESITDEVLARFELKRLPDKIELVKEEQTPPGDPDHIHRTSGLNTDADGAVSNSPISNVRAHKVRNKKLDEVRKVLSTPKVIGSESADVLVIGWGSTKGVIEEAIAQCEKEGISAAGMPFHVVYPLPLDLKEKLAKYKTVMTIELAYGDKNKPAPLAMLIRNETLLDIKSGIADPTGRPIKPLDVVAKVKEMI